MSDISLVDFSLPATGGNVFNLRNQQGKLTVLYFYPKDATPGCTTEGQQFAQMHDKFSALGVEVFGISRDTLSSHEKFKSKLSLPFELLSDMDEHVCQLFDVIKMKNMYGKQVRGIERSTFVIDHHGNICKEWRGVKVDGHAQIVFDFITAYLSENKTN